MKTTDNSLGAQKALVQDIYWNALRAMHASGDGRDQTVFERASAFEQLMIDLRAFASASDIEGYIDAAYSMQSPNDEANMHAQASNALAMVQEFAKDNGFDAATCRNVCAFPGFSHIPVTWSGIATIRGENEGQWDVEACEPCNYGNGSRRVSLISKIVPALSILP